MVQADKLLTRAQQNRFHAMLRDIAKYVTWCGRKFDEKEWKHIVLAGAYGQDVVLNPFRSGVVVMNKRRSSELPKSGPEELPNMTAMISELQAFGDENGVVWSDPSKPPLECYERDREAA